MNPQDGETAMIRITDRLFIEEREVRLEFVRSGGPGGQNVNKVATAVRLRFDAAHSPSLSDPIRRRLARLAGRRMTAAGELLIDARRFRTQERNRQEAISRLADLLRRAAQPQRPRRRTRPTAASLRRRLEFKRRRRTAKRRRERVSDEDAP